MSRLAATLIALTAAAALAGQTIVTWRALGDGANVLRLLWTLGGYFTVLTNALVCLCFLGEALGLWRIGALLGGALALSIAVVGTVYHALLAGLTMPEGLAFCADQGLHTVVPLAVVLWWLLLAPKRELGLAAPLLWMLWPLAYLIYALLRGWATGRYPYPFMDLSDKGALIVARNLSGLFVLGLIAGFAMRWLGSRPGSPMRRA